MSDFLGSAGAGSVVWVMGLFLGVAYWAFRPGRRASGPRPEPFRGEREDDGR